MNESFPKNISQSKSRAESAPTSQFSESEISASIASVQSKYPEHIESTILSAIATSLRKNLKHNPSISFTQARTYALHEQLDQYKNVSWGAYTSALGVLFNNRKKARAELKKLAMLIEDSEKVIAARGGDPDD